LERGEVVPGNNEEVLGREEGFLRIEKEFVKGRGSPGKRTIFFGN
jgi:hypothetical protein